MVSILSLTVTVTGFCHSKKYGLKKSLLWFRVWMFPVLTLTFVCAVISSFRSEKNHMVEYPLQASLAVIGYIWSLVLVVIMLCVICDCSFTGTTTTSEDVEMTQQENKEDDNDP